MAEATGLWDAESIIFNRGHSVASWTFTGRVFHRPVERAPAYTNSIITRKYGYSTDAATEMLCNVVTKTGHIKSVSNQTLLYRSCLSTS